MANILVVDDELGIRELLSDILNDEGYSVSVAENAAQARAHRNHEAPDLVLLDIWMPDTDGVTLLKEWGSNGQLTMPVIMMSGHATIETAVEATKIGALDFLEKPITLQKLLKAVNQALSKAEADAARNAKVLLHSERESLVHPSVVPVAAETTVLLVPGEQTFKLDKPLRDARDDFEKAYFEFHLAREAGSMTRVAEKTGLERTHLYRKLKQLGVDLSKPKKVSSEKSER